MDSFVVVAAGPSAWICKYYVDRTVNDLNRFISDSEYRVVQQAPSGAQAITHLDCANSFYSNLLVYSATNKSIVVYDVAARWGSVVAVLPFP